MSDAGWFGLKLGHGSYFSSPSGAITYGVKAARARATRDDASEDRGLLEQQSAAARAKGFPAGWVLSSTGPAVVVRSPSGELISGLKNARVALAVALLERSVASSLPSEPALTPLAGTRDAGAGALCVAVASPDVGAVVRVAADAVRADACANATADACDIASTDARARARVNRSARANGSASADAHANVLTDTHAHEEPLTGRASTSTTPGDVGAMALAALRGECTRRGLQVSGVKDVLVARLRNPTSADHARGSVRRLISRLFPVRFGRWKLS